MSNKSARFFMDTPAGFVFLGTGRIYSLLFTLGKSVKPNYLTFLSLSVIVHHLLYHISSPHHVTFGLFILGYLACLLVLPDPPNICQTSESKD